MTGTNCLSCGRTLSVSFCDLGLSPLSNAFVTEDKLGIEESFYPLHAYVCASCFLVQLAEFKSPSEIFGDYAYFSSYSSSWLAHAKRYVTDISTRLSLDKKSHVVELASNDGYLLQYFVEAGVRVLGVEPAANVAAAARKRGVRTEVEFFGLEYARRLATQGDSADLIVANNVLAHVPNLNDFVAGIAALLNPDGWATIEFPHLLKLMQKRQFDTIYHEHFSYFSLFSASLVFQRAGLKIVDVEEIETHGGSLRLYVRHDGHGPASNAVARLARIEEEAGLTTLDAYRHFDQRVQAAKRDLLAFLISAKNDGKSVAAYGAAAKGNTLLNYCGIRTDFIDYVVDLNPHKQGRYLPGTRIPIRTPELIRETKPDYVLILPWNLKDEIIEQLSFIREWGGKFVTPIPDVAVS